MPKQHNHDANKNEKEESNRAFFGYTSRDTGTIESLCSRGNVLPETPLTWRATACPKTAFFTMQRARAGAIDREGKEIRHKAPHGLPQE